MPTKKKRVGFIPREDVLKIIDQLSIENNLSNSKIISILVEEALYIRGIINKKYGKATKSNIGGMNDPNDIFENSSDFVNNTKFTIDNKLGNHFNPIKSTNLNQPNQATFDLQTYKKFLLFLEFQEMMDKYNT